MKYRIVCVLLLLVLSGCAPSASQPTQTGSAGHTDKISVIATLFPQYDFARQIAGDKAEVKLLLPAGVESHSYEPSPADLAAISNCDLFVYTGKEMEPWAETLIGGAGTVRALDISAGIAQPMPEHTEEDGHTHHEFAYNPHIWTDPVLAKQMVSAIADALCEADSNNADFYRTNEAAYLTELDQLDEQFRTIVQNGRRKKMIFGGRFAFHYFVQRYGLEYDAAFDSCSAETEPSAAAVARIISQIRTEGIPVVYYEELTEPKVAQSISQETGAEPLLFHSCHNVSKDELSGGATYLSLMRQNAENLKRGLNETK